ncbi:MAG: TrkH family potassium uptake protein [Polyangiaceae bacterium]|nr:TrkH family potassium uptake protein [Polyangiaceae bacterium]
MQPPAPPGLPKPEQETTAWRRARASLLQEPASAQAVVALKAGLAAPRPPFAWTRPATLLLGSAALLAVDLALAITPRISMILTAIETLLVPAWIVALIVLERTVASMAVGQAPADRGKRHWAAFGIVLVLVVASIIEKWVLLAVATSGAQTDVVAQYRSYTVFVFVLTNISVLGRRPLERLLATATQHPARLMLLSFGVTALLGAFMLTLPQAVRRIEDASFVDGLFMATSAVCVTGLSVHDVAVVYTPFGQAVLLSLVQVGGLGIMALSTFFAILAGRSLRLRDARVMAEMIDAESFSNLRRSLRSIVAYTLLAEGIGIFLLLAVFEQYPETSMPPTEGAPLSGSGSLWWAAVFHGVNAFCHGGFSLFREGMAPLVGSLGTNAVIISLIFIGSLGFPVHDEIMRWLYVRLRGIRPTRLSLHTRVVVMTTAVLIVVGAVGFLVLEWGRALGHLSVPNRFLAALFQSVTTRSGGFQTVNFGAMSHATWFFTCVLMFVGGAPASTGGGVKVTTVAVLYATLRAELRGYEAPRLLGRTIPATIVRRAMGVALLTATLVAGLIFILLLIEPAHPFAIVFETISAFGTVGLSTGITTSLSTAGRLALTVAMFIGRIGPLTLALALANQAASRAYRLPEERIGIG